MRDLEQLLRDGLAHLADETATAVPLAQRVRAARRRRTRAWVGAAAAVVLIAGGAGVVLRGSGADSAPDGSPTSGAPDLAPDVPGGYRVEVWHDIGVYVPATWGRGGAPGACGTGPTVGADGHRLGDGDLIEGYVGRPVAQTPRCSTSSPALPEVPYVWLGADVPVGTQHLGGGWVQQTRKVAGTTVTVGAQEADLRRSILASADVMSSGACAASLASPPSPGEAPSSPSSGSGNERFAAVSMTVCAYAPETSTPAGTPARYDLLAEETVAAGPAKQLADAVAQAAPMGEHSCYAGSGGEWALLRLDGGAGRSRDYVVDLSCPSIADPTGLQHELTSADVLPWAVDGINAVLHGSPLVDVPGVLIPR